MHIITILGWPTLPKSWDGTIYSRTSWHLFAALLMATGDGSIKRAVFCIYPAIAHNFRNILSEILGTFVLLACIFYFADAAIKDENTTTLGLGSIGAIPVALVLWGIGLSFCGTTDYEINPARDLGPCIKHALLPIKGKIDSSWGYAGFPLWGRL